jgi:hypothetical protein
VGHQVIVSRTSAGDGGCDVPSGRHMLELFKRTVGYHTDDIRVARAKSIKYKHSGFGSNVSYNTATLAGLNALFGSPLSPHDMWEMITRNYVENAKDDRHVYFGLETGVGEACLFFGGLVWVDEKHGNGRFLGNLSSENLWVTTAVGNYDTLSTETLRAHGEGADMSGTTEASFVPSHFVEWQKRYGEAWRNFIEKKLRPALYRNDLFAFLRHGAEQHEQHEGARGHLPHRRHARLRRDHAAGGRPVRRHEQRRAGLLCVLRQRGEGQAPGRDHGEPVRQVHERTGGRPRRPEALHRSRGLALRPPNPDRKTSRPWPDA